MKVDITVIPVELPIEQFEVRPYKELPDEIVETTDAEADGWSVYARYISSNDPYNTPSDELPYGLGYCVADCTSRADAEALADFLFNISNHNKPIT